jgi:hypothetical protein
LTPTNSDLEDIVNNEIKLEKLMQDLAFIDEPLSTKRLRQKKSKNSEFDLTIKKQDTTMSGGSSEYSEDEKKRRKNKQQVKILQNEYIKNTNWTREFMMELAKKTGLKASQVYKWNWDQKKKEAEENKLKRMFYPNEIF